MRTGTSAAREVPPLAPLHDPSACACSQGEAHGGQRTSSGVSHPEPWGCLHGLSPPPAGGGSPPLPCATASTVQIPCHRQPPLDGQASVTMRCPRAVRVGARPSGGLAVGRVSPQPCGGYRGDNIALILGQRPQGSKRREDCNWLQAPWGIHVKRNTH
jgi:hypothetical protein